MKFGLSNIGEQVTLNGESKTLGSRSEFYLVYLLFYFVPWFWVRPTTIDIIAIIVALAIFIPIHANAFRKQSQNSIPHMLAMSVIGFAIVPFNGMHGVFHIYAAVQAGYLRPAKKAWMMLFALSFAFLCGSLLIDQHWSNVIFPLFIGFVSSISCMSSAEQIEKNNDLERSRVLDQHLATISERERIARDLHDLLGQTLTMVTLKSEVAAKLFDSDPNRAKQEIDEIRNASRTALKEVRDAVAGMTITSVEAEITRAKQVLSAANVSLKIVGNVPDLNGQKSNIIGMTIREAMTNIARHSMATHAVLTFREQAGEITVVVEDNGHSNSRETFQSDENETQLPDENIVEGAGLSGVRDRITSLGGRVKIERDAGVRITLYVPQAG